MKWLRIRGMFERSWCERRQVRGMLERCEGGQALECSLYLPNTLLRLL